VGEPVSDEHLMLAFKGGDVSAFQRLAERHRGPVFNFLLRLCGHRQVAEDLLQETWIKVIRSASRYEAKAKYTTWLYTIARNVWMDAARKETFRRTESLDAQGEEGGDERSLGERVVSSDASPDRLAHCAKVRPLILQALEGLPKEQREVFVLREYHGVSFKDIGEITGVSENTVKSRMRYALEALRRKLTGMGIVGDMADEERPVTVAH